MVKLDLEYLFSQLHSLNDEFSLKTPKQSDALMFLSELLQLTSFNWKDILHDTMTSFPDSDFPVPALDILILIIKDIMTDATSFENFKNYIGKSIQLISHFVSNESRCCISYIV